MTTLCEIDKGAQPVECAEQGCDWCDAWLSWWQTGKLPPNDIGVVR